MINDERGAFFVFGPWWFVIIVMIIALIAGLLKQNDAPRRNVKQINEYRSIEESPQTRISDKLCPKCRKINNQSAGFCIRCGSPLTQNLKIYCPICKKENLAEAKYCQECGNKF